MIYTKTVDSFETAISPLKARDLMEIFDEVSTDSLGRMYPMNGGNALVIWSCSRWPLVRHTWGGRKIVSKNKRLVALKRKWAVLKARCASEGATRSWEYI